MWCAKEPLPGWVRSHRSRIGARPWGWSTTRPVELSKCQLAPTSEPHPHSQTLAVLVAAGAVVCALTTATAARTAVRANILCYVCVVAVGGITLQVELGNDWPVDVGNTTQRRKKAEVKNKTETRARSQATALAFQSLASCKYPLLFLDYTIHPEFIRHLGCCFPLLGVRDPTSLAPVHRSHIVRLKCNRGNFVLTGRVLLISYISLILILVVYVFTTRESVIEFGIQSNNRHLFRLPFCKGHLRLLSSLGDRHTIS
jgi:hypothetical protein